ncbi:hypothetical protein Tco_0699367 [Tanacetum coccineum]
MKCVNSGYFTTETLVDDGSKSSLRLSISSSNGEDLQLLVLGSLWTNGEACFCESLSISKESSFVHLEYLSVRLLIGNSVKEERVDDRFSINQVYISHYTFYRDLNWLTYCKNNAFEKDNRVEEE